MKSVLTILILVLTGGAYAVGWEEVLPSEMASKGIIIHSKYLKFGKCTSFEIDLPNNLFFEDLGNREFSSASYVSIIDGPITFPLSGTRVDTPAIKQKNSVKVRGICISTEDLSTAYLVANYWGTEGSVPMVVYFHLDVEK